MHAVLMVSYHWLGWMQGHTTRQINKEYLVPPNFLSKNCRWTQKHTKFGHTLSCSTLCICSLSSLLYSSSVICPHSLFFITSLKDPTSSSWNRKKLLKCWSRCIQAHFYSDWDYPSRHTTMLGEQYLYTCPDYIKEVLCTNNFVLVPYIASCYQLILLIQNTVIIG